MAPRSRSRAGPQAPGKARRAAQHAFQELLEGAGCKLTGELRGSPARAARLWTEHLLAGEGIDPARALGRGVPTRSRGPVVLLRVGVHLICPHHLTVAFGYAHVAYVPGGRLAGYGALARLIRACTARLVLQEDAAGNIAATLVTALGARAAAAVIEATHPCHNVAHPRSHAARAVTWGEAGDATELTRLVRRLSAGMREQTG